VKRSHNFYYQYNKHFALLSVISTKPFLNVFSNTTPAFQAAGLLPQFI